MHDVTVIDDPAAAEASLDPIRARLLAELAEPGSASTLAGARRAHPPEGELPPAGAGAPRAGRAGRGAPQGQLHRARAPGDGRVLRDLADRPVGGRAGPVARARPALRALAARARGAAGPRGRRADHRGERRRQAASRRSASTARSASRPRRTARRSPPSWPTPSTRLVAKYHDADAPAVATHRFVVALHPSITHDKEPQS